MNVLSGFLGSFLTICQVKEQEFSSQNRETKIWQTPWYCNYTMRKFTSCLEPWRLRQESMYKLHTTELHFSYIFLKPIKTRWIWELHPELNFKLICFTNGFLFFLASAIATCLMSQFQQIRESQNGSYGKRPQWIIRPKPPAQVGSS